MAQHADTTPWWIDSCSLPRFPKLRTDETADVVVVGGGITGLTAAYLLTKAGRSVIVLERGRCASIDTGHTTAHLTMVTDRRLRALAKSFGKDHARAAWDAGAAAVSRIEAIARDEGIACDFARVEGFLHGPIGGPADPETFRREAELAVELGFAAELVDAVPWVGGPGIRYPDQARFHPRKYLAGLARAILAGGGRIHEHSATQEFQADPLRVGVNGRTITCADLVIATHNPLVGIRGMPSATRFQTKLALYTSYVIAGRVPKGTVPDALLWDTADPYHYMRVEPHRSHDLVIFGGEDHKTGKVSDTEACFDRLRRTLEALVPGVGISHRWSGQVIETPDGLPFIGCVEEHQHFATGFAGNGMTFGTLGATVAADAILGRPNPWSGIFDAGRTVVHGGTWDYLKENVDYPYHLIRDRLTGAEGTSVRAVRRGTGMVLELEGKKVAAYRDDEGTLSLRSATCTHMGCTVGWNEAERSWDCPCHGSRFRPDGSVISGPAETPLGAVE